ncbi:MAG: ABC transporter ATP-binding protein/permease [Clostridiales bacterium]|nr:ABC transporter ATP-binding protein/permease [Clostridiales bacterium]
MIWETSQFIRDAVTLIISVVIIAPLLKLGFTKTGDSFFERPIFLITLIASIGLMAVIMLLIPVKMNKSYLAANEAYAELNRLFYAFIDIFKDYTTGKKIRIYNEQNLINHIASDKILTDGERTLRKISMRTAKSSSAVAILGVLVGFGVYLFIGAKGLLGLFGLGSLVLYCSSFMQIINGIMCVANTLGKMVEIFPQARLYFEIAETQNSMAYGEKEIDLSRFDVEFKNVSFEYPNAKEYSLKNINLTITKGEHLAVVGRNGSGKTTFIKLLCRLYDVTDGEILINGTNIKDYTKDSILKLYSVMFQDFHMFAVPLCSNISASESYDKEKLHICLENANIKDMVLAMDKKRKDLPI